MLSNTSILKEKEARSSDDVYLPRGSCSASSEQPSLPVHHTTRIKVSLHDTFEHNGGGRTEDTKSFLCCNRWRGLSRHRQGQGRKAPKQKLPNSPTATPRASASSTRPKWKRRRKGRGDCFLANQVASTRRTSRPSDSSCNGAKRCTPIEHPCPPPPVPFSHPCRFLSFPQEHVRVDLAVFLCAIAATRRLATSCRPIFHMGCDFRRLVGLPSDSRSWERRTPTDNA